MDMRGVVALACMLLALGCSAARQGEFILTDQSTGLPILSCSVPKGWLAGGKVLWMRNISQPVRHYAIATEPRTGNKMILGSKVTLIPKNPYTPLAQAADITNPTLVARRLTDEIAGLYGMKNVRVAGATLDSYDAKVARPVIDGFIAEARRSQLNLTRCSYGLLRLRYFGQVTGRPQVVNCFAPYCLVEINGMSSLGNILSADSCSTTLEGENAGIALMEAFARTRKPCPMFELYCNNLIQKGTLANIRSQNECMDVFLRTTGENARRISAANARWCDAIRGEERVVNPHTGMTTFVSTQYDHCSLGANGEVLYWNGDGAAARFNPNQSSAFNHTTWTAPKKIR